MESKYQEFEIISLKYVCVNRYHVLAVAGEKLKVSTGGMKFKCRHNYDILKSRYIEIDILSVKDVQSSDVNSLLKINLRPEAYDRYFDRGDTEDNQFRNTLWLCFDMANLETYKSVVSHLLHIWNPTFSYISPSTYDQFKFQFYKRTVRREFVSDWTSCVIGAVKRGSAASDGRDPTSESDKPSRGPKASKISSSLDEHNQWVTIDDLKISLKLIDIDKLPPLCHDSQRHVYDDDDVHAAPFTSSLNDLDRMLSRSEGPATATSNTTKKERKRRSLYHTSQILCTDRQKEASVGVLLNRTFLYCPSDMHGIEVSDQDLRALALRKNINDNIINAYLSYIYHELLTPDQRDTAHFFNAFFFNKLMGTVEQQEVDTASSRHARVANWTNNVDVFSKDFIVIPAFEDGHWYLVIVCFAWMVGVVDFARLYGSSHATDIPINTSEFATKTRYLQLAVLQQRRKVNPMPCVMVLDSRESKNRIVKINQIRDYLKIEWNLRRRAQGGPLQFDRSTCRGYAPVVPKQTNASDCGLFLLQYVESFFKSPVESFDRDALMLGLCHWFTHDDIEKKRRVIRRNILSKAREMVHDDSGPYGVAHFVSVL